MKGRSKSIQIPKSLKRSSIDSSAKKIPGGNQLKTCVSLLYLGFCVFVLSSCSSTYKINTSPEGAVVNFNGQKIGETPLEFGLDKITSQESDGFFITIEKEGHKRLWVWLPKDGEKLDLFFNLSPFYLLTERKNQFNDYEVTGEDLNNVIANLLSLQLSLFKGQTIDKTTMENLLETNPNLGTVYYLAAINSLNSGNNTEARRLLSLAMRYAPHENDFLVLSNELGLK